MFESIPSDILRYIASFTYPISATVCKAWSRHLSFSAIQEDFGIETVDCHMGIPKQIARQIIGLRTVNVQTDMASLKYINNNVKHIYLWNDYEPCIHQLQEFTALESLIIDTPVNCISGIHHFRHLKSIEMIVTSDIQNLSDIGKIHTLEKLYISLNQTIDFEFIRGNEKLESLDVCGDDYGDIEFDISHLRYNKKLKNLLFNYCDLQNSDSFQYIRDNLISLNLTKASSYSCKSLSHLVELKSLIINGNYHDHDSSFLQYLVNLETLELIDSVYMDLKYISAFKNLVKLKRLRLPSWNITNISFLQGLPLVSLNISKCMRLKDVSCISKLSNLKELDIYLNSTADYSPLQSLLQLEKLNVHSYGTPSFDLSFLHGMTNVQTMSIIGFNWLNNISSLRNMRKLKNLHLRQCGNIDDLSGIRELSQLKCLIIDGLCNIQDLSPIECLHLDRLEIWNCEMITDVSSLRNVKNLELYYNSKITSLESIGKLVQLERLIIHDVKVTDISPLASLTNLNRIDLCSHQNVRDISCLQRLTQLQSIRLIGFQAVTDISFLSSLRQLTDIWLEGLQRVTNNLDEFKVYSKTLNQW